VLPTWLPERCPKCNKELEVAGMLPGKTYPPDWQNTTSPGEHENYSTSCPHCTNHIVATDPASAKGVGNFQTQTIQSDANSFLRQCGIAFADQTTIRVAMASGAMAEDFFVLRFDQHPGPHGRGNSYQIHLRSADGRYEMEMSVQS